MEDKLTLKRDFVFTRLFSKKGNESFLIDFLESILEIKINDIQVIPEARLLSTSETNKFGTLDLKVTTDNGIIINVEMQMQNTQKIEKRSAFYAGKIMADQLKRSQNYNELNKLVMINILNYNFIDVEEYHNQTVTVLKEYRNYEIDIPVTYHFIELPKFRKAKPDFENKLYQWLSFIDGENREMVEMAVRKNKEIEKANEEWEYLTGDEEIKRLEYLELKKCLDDNTMKLIIEEEATKKGKMEEKIEIAKKMLEKNTNIELIKEITELTKEEILKLQNKM